MANTNVSRAGTLAQKKVTMLMSANVTAENVIAAGGTLAVGTNNFLIGTLPERSVITDAYIVVDTAANSATSAAVTVGIAEEGAEIMASTSVAAVPATGVIGTLVNKRKTSTGLDVYVGITYTGATTNFGDFTVVIRYDEYTKRSGEYTRFS
ncbi:hypothetical protein [Dickeya phage Amaethon]|nr:hypothetical protein [Dickeya phage Amaethon]